MGSVDAIVRSGGDCGEEAEGEEYVAWFIDSKVRLGTALAHSLLADRQGMDVTSAALFISTRLPLMETFPFQHSIIPEPPFDTSYVLPPHTGSRIDTFGVSVNLQPFFRHLGILEEV